MLESLFKKVAALKVRNFIKKRSQLRFFPVNIAKFLRRAISKNICERQLFDCFNGLMLHGPKGSNSKLYDGVFLVFVFKSACLVLNRVPTCVRKLKTNTFNESTKFLYWLILVVLDRFRLF